MSEPLPYKISTLIYIQDESGRILLMERAKSPNKGLWSPIGGKLEMATGESPYEAARREVFEEVGLQLVDGDLHLFGMIAERGYEQSGHWLMFLFDCQRRLKELPETIPEGRFAFHDMDKVGELPLPETDHQTLWPLYCQRRHGFTAFRADCRKPGSLEIVEEESLPRIIPD